MSYAKHSLLMQKMVDGAKLYDLVTDFGIVCLDFPFKVSGGAKEVAVNDWPDEDGEDVYVGDKLYLSAYDIEAEFGYEGTQENIYNSVMSLLNYLNGNDGSGTPLLKIYQPHTCIGRQNVYLSNISDENLYVQRNSGIVTFKLTFHVCDPVTQIIPNENETSLLIKL